MNHAEILEKAVALAIANGWTIGDWTGADDFEHHITTAEDGTPYLVYGGMGEEFYMGLGAMILDHDFAKAIWGTEENEFTDFFNADDSSNLAFPAYELHLMRMVIAADPIAYLGAHLA